MKTKLIALLNELLEETDKINFVGIKVSIMMNTEFLANPKTFGELSNLMEVVNSYIDTPNDSTKEMIKQVIKRIDEKF